MANKYAIGTTFSLIDNATAPLSKISGVTNELGKSIKREFSKAQLQVEGFGKQIEKATGYMKKAAAAALAAGAAAAGAFVVQGVKGAVEFQNSLEKVGAAANLTGDQIKQFSNDIINLSNNLGSSVHDLASAQLEAISQGIKAADSVKFVEVATRAAKGGFTDTSKVISSLTSVLKSYGLEASEAGKVSDQMMVAARLGGVSFEDMATKLEKVLPVAAQFGVTSDELFASVSALTSQGVPIEAAAKQIKSALEKSGKKGLFNLTPGEKFNDMLHQISNSAGATQTAYERVDATLGNQWQNTLTKVKNVGLKLGTALLPAFQKIIDKVSLFAGKFAELDFSPLVSKIEGALDRIFESIDFDKLVNGIGSFFTAISETANRIISLVEGIWKLRKPITAIIMSITILKGVMLALAVAEKVLAGWNAIKTGASYAYHIVIKKQTQALTFLTAETKGVKIATEAWALVMKGWQGVKHIASLVKMGVVTAASTVKTYALAAANKIAAGAQWLLNAAMTANPIGLIIAGIVALIAIIVLLVKNFDKVKETFQKVMDFFQTGIEKIKEIFNEIGEVIGNIFFGLFDSIKEKFFGFIDVIRNGWESVKGFFGGVAEKVGGFFSGNINNTPAPAVANIVPPAINQITTATAGIPSTLNANRSNQTIIAATAPATSPMTAAEQYSYSQTTHRENVDIAVRAEQGTSARVTRPPRSPNVTVAASGGNR